MARKADIEWMKHWSAGENARLLLPREAARFLEAGDRMAGDDSAAPEELHQFRLSVKRFRYVLEFFQPCYGAALKDRIGLLKGLQDALGEMNDCDVAAKLVRKKLPKSDENRAVLLQKLEERTNERIELFRSRWAEGFAGHQNRRRWTDYLARYAVAPKPEEPPESNPPPEN